LQEPHLRNLNLGDGRCSAMGT